jgi:hypothetical protein
MERLFKDGDMGVWENPKSDTGMVVVGEVCETDDELLDRGEVKVIFYGPPVKRTKTRGPWKYHTRYAPAYVDPNKHATKRTEYKFVAPRTKGPNGKEWPMEGGRVLLTNLLCPGFELCDNGALPKSTIQHLPVPKSFESPPLPPKSSRPSSSSSLSQCKRGTAHNRLISSKSAEAVCGAEPFKLSQTTGSGRKTHFRVHRS